ncbi:hypothetical protein EPUS_05386 [Endocarpon pusillum Z07020]|uniref:SRR1-like domain-containing protein n=1 Tax=Endocarpon pusillum (strain Z07020 / HMAS-L-300199) TaxID=1263415 RepID=U1GNT4_ENDPU|nr:uncharacterized protein EPUS_05386 [Endocarpon pusillum Z07020]ERF73963.1 hypothetical protein EPUS_05386 [Endocarpon pusillum Z07020]
MPKKQSTSSKKNSKQASRAASGRPSGGASGAASGAASGVISGGASGGPVRAASGAASGATSRMGIDLSKYGPGLGSLGGIPPADPNYEVMDDEGLIRWKFKPIVREPQRATRLRDVISSFEQCRGHFEKSHAYHCLETSVWLRFREAHISLTNYVCFGTGSPTAGGRKGHSMSQLAVFVAIVHLLHSQQDKTTPPRMFAQEPLYNSVDERLLEHLHITVVEHPDAFRLVDSRAFAFGAIPPSFVLRGLLVRSPAILMVDNPLVIYVEESGQTERADLYAYFPTDFPNHKFSEEVIEQRQYQHEVRAAQIITCFFQDKEQLRMPEYLPAFDNPIKHNAREVHPLYIYWKSEEEGTADYYWVDDTSKF